MAPEQAERRTEDIGAATDVYALGAILFEVLTGSARHLNRHHWNLLNADFDGEGNLSASPHHPVPADLKLSV